MIDHDSCDSCDSCDHDSLLCDHLGIMVIMIVNFMIRKLWNFSILDSLVPDASDFSRQNEVDHGDEQPYGLCQY